ncbi:MAG TPA: LptF/LptG family permease [Phycisphaerales bacterium]|nr:LptF/LptG family permease [Phycisphaerales bacterium]
MHRRPPFILWLYLLADLWKLVLLTTGVLVTVIAFAAAVKPLADGKLGPEDTLKFMFLAMVPMLQYALPFAACFGATLAYHRMATDNELTAVHAAGISHRSMLVPAAFSGIVLAGILLALSNSIIPRFLKGMSELVAQDAAKWIVNTVQRGEALNVDGTFVYADVVKQLGPDPASGSYDRLWLGGLLVVRTNEKGQIISQGLARNAGVWLRRTNVTRPGLSADKPMTQVIIRPTDMVAAGPGFRAAGDEMVKPLLIPNAFSDNVKFLSFSELHALRAEPERIDRIDKDKRALAMLVDQRRAVDAIDQSLKTTGVARFLDPYRQGVTLRASGVRSTFRENESGKRERDPWVFQILPPTTGRDIVVEMAPVGGKAQKQIAKSAFLRLPSGHDPDRGPPTMTIQLLNVAAVQVGPDGEAASPDPDVATAVGQAEQRALADLTYDVEDTTRPLSTITLATGETFKGAVVTEGEQMVVYRPGVGRVGLPRSEIRSVVGDSTNEVIRDAKRRILEKPSDEPVVAPALAKLTGDVRGLLNEVLSKEHERYAMSVACLVMVLVGSVMAMRLRDALPLTVYLWAFFPALATVLAISGGQQLTHGNGIVGLPVLWAGVAALGALAVVEFVRLRRH